jgi:CDP-diacylglycerol pyrophosphatase
MRYYRKTIRIAIIILIGANTLASVPSAAGDPGVLWKIVHDQCVPDQTSHNDPKPCVQVDLTRRWVVLKDKVGKTQFLLIATDLVTGIEDPKLLGTNSPNYWEAAWAARHFVEEAAATTLTSDQIALAINSQDARSQNQLHIHIDCIRPEVRDDLRRDQNEIRSNWTPVKLSGQDYAAMSISAGDLNRENLFLLVASQLAPEMTMDKETIVLTGATLSDGTIGFDLLAGRYGGGANTGDGERLEDHSCAVANKLAP